MFSLLEAVEGAATQCIPGIGHGPEPGGTYDHHGYTLKACSGGNPNGWDPIGEHGSQIGTWKQKGNTIRHQYKESGGRLSSEKERPPEEDVWYNLHKPQQASGTGVAAAAQWQDQQHLLWFSLASVLAAEPHHADLEQLLAPQRWEHCNSHSYDQCTERHYNENWLWLNGFYL